MVDVKTAVVLISFMANLLLGITVYSIYSAFGPSSTSQNLKDHFDEDEYEDEGTFA